MPVVTNILPQKKDPSRFNVYIDDEFAFGLSQISLANLGLAIGKQLTPTELEQVRSEKEFDMLLQKAITYLSYRPRSTRELITRLSQKIPTAQKEKIQSVADYLLEKHYLDDKAFAEWWVRQRRELGKRFGKHRIRQELRTKGIAKEYIETALQNSEEDIDESEIAYKEALKISKRVKGKDMQTLKNKCIQTLVRRGFSWDIARIATEKVLSE